MVKTKHKSMLPSCCFYFIWVELISELVKIIGFIYKLWLPFERIMGKIYPVRVSRK